MVSNIPQNTLSISVLVGHEVRVRDSQKPRNVETLREDQEKATEQKEPTKLEDSQNSNLGSEQIEEIVHRLQNTFQHVEPRIELSVDKELNQVIVHVFDKESGELIRQIPSEEVLKLHRFFADQSGLLVEEDI